MARRGNEVEQGSDKGRMRIVYVELEGNNQSLQEGLKTLVATMNKPHHGVPVPKKLPATPGSIQETPPYPPEPSLFDGATTDPDAPTPVSDKEELAQDSGNPTKKRGEGKKQDRNAGLALVADLNFRPTGKEALKSFYEIKSPTTDEERILVFVYYLSETLGTKPIGPNQILTCFKHVSIRVPLDLRQTIRNAAKNKAWLNFTSIDDIRITIEGQNVVEHELPRASTGV